jgi:hypothetical protein
VCQRRKKAVREISPVGITAAGREGCVVGGDAAPNRAYFTLYPLSHGEECCLEELSVKPSIIMVVSSTKRSLRRNGACNYVGN